MLHPTVLRTRNSKAVHRCAALLMGSPASSCCAFPEHVGRGHMVISSTLHVSRATGCSTIITLVMWDRLLSMMGGQQSAEIMWCVLQEKLA